MGSWYQGYRLVYLPDFCKYHPKLKTKIDLNALANSVGQDRMGRQLHRVWMPGSLNRMRQRTTGQIWAAGISFALIAMVLTPGLGWAQGTPKALDPQPAEDQLQAGLSVKYYYDYYRTLRGLERKIAKSEGKVGQPIMALDFHVGEGKVLTSKRGDGVGAHIQGLIHLDKPGIYTFMAQSNDGVRIEIGGEKIIEDPDVHKDRFSEPGGFVIDQAGWYPLSVLYFERKSTSTLELYWRPPEDESDSMQLVPAKAFAHMKEPAM